ncbi:MAG TPA: tetratricopeptide repeat protein [Blastocatellia bacterium]|nr:tetratricopeptide repeat protein [Blastocatellia bacterium]
MIPIKAKFICTLAMGLGLLAFNACGGGYEPAAAPPPAPPPVPIPSEDEAIKISLRFLEDRIKRDPEDFIAHNQLAGYYLQFLRETADTRYLELATRAARASLGVLPPEMNTGGLAALTQVELASHKFASARDHAQQLVKIEPRRSLYHSLLIDALLELGDYDRAAIVLDGMEKATGNNVNTEVRFGRLALLRGQTDLAARRFATALAFALNEAAPQRETVAWCRWQLGEIAYSTGRYEEAERHYRDALVTFPDYYRAVAGLGRALAARGDRSGAIEQYERAVRILPDISFVAALGDLYTVAGRDREAQAQYALVEQIARLSQLNGALYNRQLAMFYADHDMKTEEAYTLAKKEYETRKDIYGADAVAWAALKAGLRAEAQAAIKEAMRLGTRDAKILYHAGMIAGALGERNRAREYLRGALALSPQFDPLQSSIAKRAVEE